MQPKNVIMMFTGSGHNFNRLVTQRIRDCTIILLKGKCERKKIEALISTKIYFKISSKNL